MEWNVIEERSQHSCLDLTVVGTCGDMCTLERDVFRVMVQSGW